MEGRQAGCEMPGMHARPCKPSALQHSASHRAATRSSTACSARSCSQVQGCARRSTPQASPQRHTELPITLHLVASARGRPHNCLQPHSRHPSLSSCILSHTLSSPLPLPPSSCRAGQPAPREPLSHHIICSSLTAQSASEPSEVPVLYQLACPCRAAASGNFHHYSRPTAQHNPDLPMSQSMHPTSP